jgi:PAS domain S-box-containing protein
MSKPEIPPEDMTSVILRYGLAVVSVCIALGAAVLLAHYGFTNVADPLFLFSLALTSWYAGLGPAILAVVLSSAANDYFFIDPLYSLTITPADIPHFVIFLVFALLISGFAAVRRRFERELLQSRDELAREVAERTQQASLLNLTHDSIFVRDMDFIIRYWNHGAQELYGWPAEEATGKISHQLLQTVYPIPLDDLIKELLRTGRWEGELRRTRADGTQLVVASRWSLRRERERPAVILETSNDVTDRKKNEEAIQTLNRDLERRTVELEAANKELEAFAYSISHDLRAPLRHTAGYAELLQKHALSILDEKGRRYMGTILESAKRMGELIDDLLTFSRIGRAETQKTVVSMDQLVGEVLTEVRRDTDGRKINWRIGPLANVYGDRSMLRVVLVNLISNAAKFTRKRDPAEVEIGCSNGSQGEVVFYVKDNGVGFDMKYVDKLFRVFQRLHRAEDFEGTGIGLATVERIIHRHGGRIWAEGELGRGASFYFAVPKSTEVIEGAKHGE